MKAVLKLALAGFLVASRAFSAEPAVDMSEQARCHGMSKPNDSAPWAMSVLAPNVLKIEAGTKVTQAGYLLSYKNNATLDKPVPKDISGPFSLTPVKWQIWMLENEAFGKGATTIPLAPPHFIATTTFDGLLNSREKIRIDSRGRGHRLTVLPNGEVSASINFECDYDPNSNELRN